MSTAPDTASSREQVTLADVAAALDLWRKNKKSKDERIPQDIIKLIGKIIPKYSKGTIIHMLRLHSSKYDSIKNSVTVANDANHFIPFRLVNANTLSNQDSGTKCEIYSSNRTKLVIHSMDVTSVIKAFMSCSN
jgi:hypothetical protein